MFRFNLDDTAMILIDHQVGTNTWASSISALEEGFNVQVVCDACGSSNPIAEEMSWRRMERAGVRLTSTNAMVAELVKNWASPAGAVAFPLLT